MLYGLYWSCIPPSTSCSYYIILQSTQFDDPRPSARGVLFFFFCSLWLDLLTRYCYGIPGPAPPCFSLSFFLGNFPEPRPLSWVPPNSHWSGYWFIFSSVTQGSQSTTAETDAMHLGGHFHKILIASLAYNVLSKNFRFFPAFGSPPPTPFSESWIQTLLE